MRAHTCSASHATEPLKRLNNHETAAPMIPGRASNAFTPNFLKRSERCFNFSFIHCFTFLFGLGFGLGFGVGTVVEPRKPATMDEIIVLTNNVKADKILITVIPCSLNKVLIFSLKVVSSSVIRCIVSLIRLI